MVMPPIRVDMAMPFRYDPGDDPTRTPGVGGAGRVGAVPLSADARGAVVARR
ncbi:hypothetical protein SAMN06893096_101667 [Geodermatophilus pulveris]|uniref:Uncharacterized protein n=1 Tax=Geodermatophilus pulveris TaxID=1564159 RepID=A0A239BI86_9ACTN|nr:hypothetical protein SAMN06893096_101667 [Geodermatophilus pulveris]